MDAYAAWLDRTYLLVKDNLIHLQNKKVAIVGLGGVGGSAAEAICRAGVCSLLLVDHDVISESNINRQLFATRETIGQSKAAVGKKRLLSINPQCTVQIWDDFFCEENKETLFSYHPDYVIDAIDTLSSKISLIKNCHEQGIPIISCLGTGNRLSPAAFCIGTLEDTIGCGCPLARLLRRALKKEGISNHPVVYSTEPPLKATTGTENGRHPPGSISFCPPVAGYLLASYVINDILSHCS